MSRQLNGFEIFLSLFGELQRVCGTPTRLVSFHDENSEMSLALQNLQDFLLRADFERRVFAGKKMFGQVPKGFHAVWDNYKNKWAGAIAHVELRELADLFGPYDPNVLPNVKLEKPDAAGDSNFDPLYHDGGGAVQLGIEYLDEAYESHVEGELEYDERVANICRIALDANEYLRETIGIDSREIFRRWQALPPIFMPSSVSNKHGNEAGSLNDLLGDAIRSYVCGAPAAAIAICRPILDMLLKKHYLPNDHKYKNSKGVEKDQPIGDLIVLAEKRYEQWKAARMASRLDQMNNILHDYSRIKPLDPKDNRFVLEYLLTLKMLIEKAP